MNTPPCSPKQKPLKFHDAPLRKNNSKSAKQEHLEKCVCHLNIYCNECFDDFNHFNHSSFSLFTPYKK